MSDKTSICNGQIPMELFLELHQDVPPKSEIDIQIEKQEEKKQKQIEAKRKKYCAFYDGELRITKAMLKHPKKVIVPTEEEREQLRQEWLKKYKKPLRTVQISTATFEDLKKKRKSELVVITYAKKLLSYIFQVTSKSPKKFRYTFIGKLQNLAIEILEALFRASQLRPDIKTLFEQRKMLQQNAYTNLKLLSYMAFIAMENLCLTEKQYFQIADQTHTCLTFLHEWMIAGNQMMTG